MKRKGPPAGGQGEPTKRTGPPAGLGAPTPAPDFARAKGMAHDVQLRRPVPRPGEGEVKQLKYPGTQGGRSEKNPKS